LKLAEEIIRKVLSTKSGKQKRKKKTEKQSFLGSFVWDLKTKPTISTQTKGKHFE
jgi:hypothetical protein